MNIKLHMYVHYIIYSPFSRHKKLLGAKFKHTSLKNSQTRKLLAETWNH